jgi:hypothetical protein
MTDEFKDKIKTINVSKTSRRAPKITKDEMGETVEHWDDRVDVTVRPRAVKIRTDIQGN